MNLLHELESFPTPRHDLPDPQLSAPAFAGSCPSMELARRGGSLRCIADASESADPFGSGLACEGMNCVGFPRSTLESKTVPSIKLPLPHPLSLPCTPLLSTVPLAFKCSLLSLVTRVDLSQPVVDHAYRVRTR